MTAWPASRVSAWLAGDTVAEGACFGYINAVDATPIQVGPDYRVFEMRESQNQLAVMAVKC